MAKKLLLIISILFSYCFSSAGTSIGTSLCIKGGQIIYKMKVQRAGGLPSLSSDKSVIECRWLSSLYLGDNYAEKFWIRNKPPEDLISVIGQYYDPRYTLGALTYQRYVKFEAGEILCRGMNNPILYIQKYSSIPTLSGKRRNLIQENCTKTNVMYLQSKVAIQGAYNLESPGSGKKYIIDRLGLNKNNFVKY